MVLKIGHRGAAGHEPENTLLSFKKALDLGVDMIELDVHRCKSGEPVVIHDDKIDRTTNGKGFVIAKTLSELKKYDAGKGEKIPELSEVFDLIKRKVVINVEIKDKNSTEAVSALVKKYINRHGWSYNDFIISSLDPGILFDVKTLLGEKAKLGLIIEIIPPKLEEIIVDIDAYSINADKKIVTQKFVNEMHIFGVKIMVWTVNDADDIKQYIDYGVDGIFSDFPEKINIA